MKKEKQRYVVKTADGKLELGRFHRKDTLRNDNRIKELQKYYKDKFIIEKII